MADDLIEASRTGNDVPVTRGDIRAALNAVLGCQPIPPIVGRSIRWRRGNEPPYG